MCCKEKCEKKLQKGYAVTRYLSNLSRNGHMYSS